MNLGMASRHLLYRIQEVKSFFYSCSRPDWIQYTGSWCMSRVDHAAAEKEAEASSTWRLVLRDLDWDYITFYIIAVCSTAGVSIFLFVRLWRTRAKPLRLPLDFTFLYRSRELRTGAVIQKIQECVIVSFDRLELLVKFGLRWIFLRGWGKVFATGLIFCLKWYLIIKRSWSCKIYNMTFDFLPQQSTWNRLSIVGSGISTQSLIQSEL